MQHFNVIILVFSAIFVVKIGENFYEFFCFFLAAAAWKNVLFAVRSLVNIF